MPFGAAHEESFAAAPEAARLRWRTRRRTERTKSSDVDAELEEVVAQPRHRVRAHARARRVEPEFRHEDADRGVANSRNWFAANRHRLVRSCRSISAARPPPSHPSSGAPEGAGGGAVRGRLNHFHPQAPDRLGEFQALDLRTGETLWRRRLRVPYNTSALTTGGGLVFIGDWGRRVHAYDVRNGEPLWQSRLPTMANGFPITYAVDGRQFVAFVAGPSIGGLELGDDSPRRPHSRRAQPAGRQRRLRVRAALSAVRALSEA